MNKCNGSRTIIFISNILQNQTMSIRKNHQDSIQFVKQEEIIYYSGLVTYFLAISIFYKFLQQYPYSLSNQEFLSVSINCLGLASKYKDIYCLTSQQLVQLSADKITEDQLAKYQFQILQTILYQIEMPNYFKNFDYIMRDLEFRYYKEIGSNFIDNSLMKMKLSAIYKCTLNLLRFVSYIQFI